jgi:hypothetical protein
MKRFFFLLFVLLVSSLVFLSFLTQPSAGDLIEMVPEDAVLVMDWDNPADAWRAFVDTPLGTTLRQIKWPLILRTTSLEKDDVEYLENNIDFWSSFSSSPFFRKIFSERTVLALFAGKNPEKTSSLDYLRKNIVVLNNSGEKISLFSAIISSLPQAKKLKNIKYQGFTILSCQLDNDYTVYFTTDKKLFIAALALEPLQHCLDLKLKRILQKGGGMNVNDDYIQYKKLARDTDDFFLYVNIERLKSSFPLLSLQTKDEQSVSHKPDWLFPEKGVQQAAFYHQNLQPIHQFVSIVGFDNAALPPFQKNIYTRPPVENRKLAQMPAHVLAYFWTNWLDLPAWWQMTKSRATGADGERVDRFGATIHKYTGMPIEEFLDLFGDQVGLNVKEIKTSGFFPVPRLCFCVELTDPGKIKSMLEKYLAGLPQHRDMVAGVPVVSVLAAGGLMQPSYALLEDFLILADGRDQIEDILKPGSDLLVSDADFLEVDMGLQQENNLVVFSRTARLLDGLKVLAAGLGTVIAVRDEQAGARMKILLDGAIIPLLDSLTMVKAQALRSYTADGKIVLQATVLMAEK